MSNAVSPCSAVIAEIETIEAEVELVRACVRDEGRVMSDAERGYLDELLLDRAALHRSIQRQQADMITQARLRRLHAYAQQRDAAVQQMQFGGLAVVSGVMLTEMTSIGFASGSALLVLWGAVAFGGFRFVRGLTDYLRR